MLLFRGGQRIGDFAHLGVHAGIGDHHAAPAICHSGAHIGHVLSVAQGNVLLLPQLQCIDPLADGHGFAGEGRLLHLHTGTVENASVGGHGVSRFQNHNIAGHQLLAGQGDDLPVPKHLGGGCRDFL